MAALADALGLEANTARDIPLAALMKALDGQSSLQLGENGSVEHGWSTDHDEQFAQLYFQLIRATSAAETKAHRERYRGLLRAALRGNPARARELFALVGHVRDVEQKGERQIAYGLIWEWYAVSQPLAFFAVTNLVHGLDASGRIVPGARQLGGWSDVKYFCNAVKEYSGGDETHPLIGHAHALMIAQLRLDSATLEAGGRPQLAAKWLPKENRKTVETGDGVKKPLLGKYTWQFYQIAERMFPYAATASAEDSRMRARAKACRSLRKLCAPLNRALGTVEIAMASKEGMWDQLSFGRDENGQCGEFNVAGATLRRHTRAWKNETKTGERRSEDEHRVACAANYVGHMEKVAEGTATVRGATLNTYELAKDAATVHAGSVTEVARINGQWATNSAGAPACGPMVALCDVSSSMSCDDGRPLYSAMGTAIRISETCAPECLRDRIMTFSSTPSWVQLGDLGDDFVGKVQRLQSDRNWGMSTDLVLACEMIAEALAAAGVKRGEAPEVILTILSDMQIDGGQDVTAPQQHDVPPSGGWGAAMSGDAWERIASCFNAKGYPCPHIVWWNLRTTEGFPTVMDREGTTCVSGYSASLLKAFQERGVEALKDATPMAMIASLLEDERLAPLRAAFDRMGPRANVAR